jgi:hypothetical protein
MFSHPAIKNWITVNFGKNPRSGGSPAIDKMATVKFILKMFLNLLVEIWLIKFILEIEKNKVTIKSIKE